MGLFDGEEERARTFFERNQGLFVRTFQRSPTFNGLLWPHQGDALAFAMNWLQNEAMRQTPCVIVMPTGSGKSTVLVLAPILMGVGGCLVLAPSRQLQGQLAVNFAGDPQDAEIGASSLLVRRGFFANLQKNRINVLEATPEGNYDQLRAFDVMVSTAQAFNQQNREAGRRWAETLPWDHLNLLIVDEAHHFPARFWAEVVGLARRHRTPVLFLTATPYRHDNQRVVEGELYRFPRNDAVRLRIIRDARLHLIECHRELGAMGAAVNLRLQEKDRETPLPGGAQHRALVIAANLESANNLQREWDAAGLRVGLFHSALSEFARNRVLAAFQNGDLRILIVVECLKEGYDFAPLSVVAFCTNVKSPVKLDQYIGRGVRIVRGPDGPENAAIHCDVMVPDHFTELPALYDRVIAEEFVVEE